MKGFKIFKFLLIGLLICHSAASAELITFEELGLTDGQSLSVVNPIGVATFYANASIQGSGYAFIGDYGSGTGDISPFSETGNTFITNPGGLGGTDKTITIDFSVPVRDLSFYACDVI
jgi:hypothetical protein